VAPALGGGDPIATQRNTTTTWRLPFLLVPGRQSMAYEAVDRFLDSISIAAAFLFQKAFINEGINLRFV
jgi:hypothetical protein